MIRCFANFKKISVALAVLFAVLSVFVGGACALTGSGTSSDPYTISNMQDLQLLSGEGYIPYEGTGKYFVLGNDINFGGMNLEPIGTEEHPFTGNFNGKEFTISNIHFVDRSTGNGNLGMFTMIGTGGVVKNFGLKDCTLSSNGSYNGFLAGKLASSGVTVDSILIDNCTGSCVSYLGGIVGIGNSNPTGSNTIEKCIVLDTSLTVSSVGVGGICGIGALGGSVSSESLNVTDCMVMSTYLYGGGQAGGLIGNSTDGSSTVNVKSCGISACYLGIGSSESVGGAIGTVSNGNTYLNGCVTDNSYIKSGSGGFTGGLVGSVKSGNCSITSGESTLNTLISDGSCGGVLGFGIAGVTVTDCKVNQNCIIGSCAGGVSGDSNVMVSGGSQDSNNIVGSSEGKSIANPTNQTKDANVYVTFTGLSTSYDVTTKKAVFTISGQRGSSVMLSGKKVAYLYSWQYEYPTNATVTNNATLEYVYSSTGTFTPTLTLRNESQPSGVLKVSSNSTAASSIVIDEPLKVEPDAVNTGGTAKLTMKAHTTGSGLVSYQWYSSSDSGNTWKVIGNSAEEIEFVPLSTGTYHFKCILSDGITSVDTWDSTKDVFVLVGVGMSPVITSLTVNPAKGDMGTSFTVSATATGTSTLTYQYYYSSDNGSTWRSVGSGGNSSQSVSFPVTGKLLIKCVVLDAYGQSTDSFSNYSTFNNVSVEILSNLPTFTMVSVSPNTGGSHPSLALNSSGLSGATSYIWEMSQDKVNWQKIYEGNMPSVTQNVTFPAKGMWYIRVGGTVEGVLVYCYESQYATYEVSNLPVINSVTVSPERGGLSNTITLSASVDNATSYQWEMSYDNVNWAGISGATGTTYTQVFNFTQAGNVFFRISVSDGNSTVSSLGYMYNAVQAETAIFPPAVALVIFAICIGVYLVSLFIVSTVSPAGVFVMVISTFMCAVLTIMGFAGKIGSAAVSTYTVGNSSYDIPSYVAMPTTVSIVMLIITVIMAGLLIMFFKKISERRIDDSDIEEETD